MAVLIGGTLEMVNELTHQAAQGQVCMLANDNSTEQQVISGHKEAIERAIVLAPTLGFKRALPLKASAPFHSSLMAPAALAMQEAFEKTTFNPLALSVVPNVTAEICSESNGFRTLLVTQVAGQVRWRESLHFMAAHGVTHFLELGAGKVLSGLSKRTVPDIQTQAIGTVDEMKAFLAGS
jgi:[acyl-carrier-protein] S-malonyltransferase